MEVGCGLVTKMLLKDVSLQKIGTSAAVIARGARNRSVGATKSFNSAVNDEEALVFTTTRLKGLPHTSPPSKLTGSRPNFVRFTENSINWSATNLLLLVVAGAGFVKARLLSWSTRPKGPAQVFVGLPMPV